MRPKVMAVVLAAALVVVAQASAAATKNFRPGDLRVCVASRCTAIDNQTVLDSLSGFYYAAHQASRTFSPPPRAPYVELCFSNGYVTGIAAGRRFDRFLSFGVNLGQFAARRWYAIPPGPAAEIARLASRLRPRPLPANILDQSAPTSGPWDG